MIDHPNQRLKNRFKEHPTEVEPEPVKITYADGTTEIKTEREMKTIEVIDGKCARCGTEVVWRKYKKTNWKWKLFEKNGPPGKVHRHGPSEED